MDPAGSEASELWYDRKMQKKRPSVELKKGYYENTSHSGLVLLMMRICGMQILCRNVTGRADQTFVGQTETLAGELLHI